MKLSIVIPTYNGLPWLLEALESAASQAHRPLEVIVVDDGSTDDSAAAVRAVQARHDGVVQYVRLPRNMGRSAARNQGAALATGEVLLFLDADDVYANNHAAVVAEAFADPACEALYTVPAFIDAAGVPLGHQDLPAHRDVSELVAVGLIPYTSGLALLRRLWDRIGGFDESLHEREDWDLALSLTLAGGTLRLDPSGTVLVRQHAGNNSRHAERFTRATYRVAERSLQALRQGALGSPALAGEVCLHAAGVAVRRDVPLIVHLQAFRYMARALGHAGSPARACRLLAAFLLPRRYRRWFRTPGT